MILYLAQHGAAVDKSINPERPLNPDGIDDVERVAAAVAAAGVAPARILHSGKARAEETADIFGRYLPGADRPAAVAGIDPMDPVEDFAHQVAAWDDDVLICGHQPFMGRLVSHLLCADATTITVDYVPGAITALSRDDSGLWRLCWFIRPELCHGS